MKDIKLILSSLAFFPKENASGIFIKKYADGYVIEIDIEKEIINYGDKIQLGKDNCLLLGEKHEENAVTLECVDKLLT
ncbi:MAG: hypothetical protein LBV39_04960, partial [Bacteroidales bacterium]|nr:hypothetical protein [Bacteroidales bacterium]